MMKGKVVAITGANSGIGRATAVALARQGARILMLCRNLEKGQKALNTIASLADTDQLDLIRLDLTSGSSVRAAATEIGVRYERIDVLINNAGLMMPNDTRTETAEGIETTFSANHLGHFLLTHLLADQIKAAPQGRIINVASEAHRLAAGIPPDDYQMLKGYSALRAYGFSKLANIMFTHELARRLGATPVTAYSLHPGVVASNFASELSGWFRLFMVMARPFMITNEQGAETSVYLASTPNLASANGQYFVKKKVKKPVPAAFNNRLTERLWELSAHLTGAPATI